MKKLIIGYIALFLMLACQENETTHNDFTGREATYALSPGSLYNMDGTVVFKEKIDGTTLITITLNGTEGDAQHPVHLHLGNTATDGAAIAAVLNPVLGKTGKSETVLQQLSDESFVSYDQILALDACVKIHLSATGPDKDIILAGTNIGKAATSNTPGRLGFGVCSSQ
jgi:hypothetical protein